MDDRLNKKGQQAKFGVHIAGRTTVDVLRRDVDKSRALRFVTEHLKLDPLATVYFGDEFGRVGNDLPIARMADAERPAVIVNVETRI
jgi:hydroxymethylpyrimidine pyrophosphatase-like HAD family hydrolase